MSPAATSWTEAKSYGELDITHSWTADISGYTPRVVVGIGHKIEIGININGIATGGLVQTTPTPTIKWKAYDGGKNGWAFLVGDDLFIPVQNRTYDVGNYSYAEFTKQRVARRLLPRRRPGRRVSGMRKSTSGRSGITTSMCGTGGSGWRSCSICIGTRCGGWPTVEFSRTATNVGATSFRAAGGL